MLYSNYLNRDATCASGLNYISSLEEDLKVVVNVNETGGIASAPEVAGQAEDSDWCRPSWLLVPHLELSTTKGYHTSRAATPTPRTVSSWPLLVLTLAMASRRLAFNLNHALRSRKALSAINPLQRGFATPVDPVGTECTTLSNGLTVW